MKTLQELTLELPEEIIDEIENSINSQLVKRGFPTVNAIHNSSDVKYPKIVIISEEFNTVPVIFKSIKIENFGGSLSVHSKRIIRDNKIEEVSYISVWIPVYVEYEHFNNGSNGSELFTYTSEVYIQEFSHYSKPRVIIRNEMIRG